MNNEKFFPDFSENSDQLKEAQEFWKNLIFVELRKEHRLTNKHLIHSEVEWDSDGNPIYSLDFYFLKKSLRIIQEIPESEDIQIGAWFEGRDESRIYDELVISLELTGQTAKIAKKLIEAWLFTPVDNKKKLTRRGVYFKKINIKNVISHDEYNF